MELSQEEKEAVLRLGNDSAHETLEVEILEKLMKKNILHHRLSDGRLDFTDFGESIYDEPTTDDSPTRASNDPDLVS